MTIFDRIRNGFLKVFGDIKVFRFPLFLLYDPGSYKVKGHEIRKVIDTVQPGDILIRGYQSYLDGYFIPGYFSHAGLFLGPVDDQTADVAPDKKDKLVKGAQIAIHSMAEGVFMEDIINFCRCDYMVILRRNKRIEPNADFELSFKEVHRKALLNLGKPYDFKFDFSDFHNLSCTEFVFDSCSDFIASYGVKIKRRRALVTTMNMLIPDDFITDKFDIVFCSNSVSKERLSRIMAKNIN